MRSLADAEQQAPRLLEQIRTRALTSDPLSLFSDAPQACAGSAAASRVRVATAPARCWASALCQQGLGRPRSGS